MDQDHKVNGRLLDVKKALSKSEMPGGNRRGGRFGGRGGRGGWSNRQDWGNGFNYFS